MSEELKKLFEEVNISEDQLKGLAETLEKDPMAAIGIIQQLNLPPDFFQRMMATVAENPNAILDMASQMGISEEAVSDLEKKLKNDTPESQ